MFKWLKKHFIKHEGNGHRPHFLEWRNMRVLIGLLMFVELVVFVIPTLNFAGFAKTMNLSAVLPGALSLLTNEERGKNSLPQLAENPLLVRIAQLKAQDMASKSYFAHTSPEGKTPWYWFSLVGYNYAYAGENLAVNFTDSRDVTQAWMNSPTHRANIVGRSYKEVGTGVATGTYKGQESVFVAQVYGTPKGQVAQARATALSSWERLMVSPHQSFDMVLLALFVLAVSALFLNIFVKFDRQHADLIGNGILLSLVIVGIYFINGFIANRNFETSFIAFEAPVAENVLPE